MIGSLTVFLQRHVCETDLKTPENVKGIFPISLLFSTLVFFVLPLTPHFLLVVVLLFCSVFFFFFCLQIWIKSLCLFTFAIPGGATSETFLVCYVLSSRSSDFVVQFQRFPKLCSPFKRRKKVFVWIMLYLECILL